MDMKVNMVVKDKKYAPHYANETDACMDIKVRIPEGSYELQPRQMKVFGTGVQVAVPNEHVMLIMPRRSTGIKLRCELANTVAVIDAGFRDEIMLAITNEGQEPVTLTDAQRVAQFLILQRDKIIPNYVEDNEEFRQGDRGGGIGSTN